MCQTSYWPGNLRPSRHLANIAERLREVVLGSGKQLKVILCAHHGEKLQLFCEEDGKLICWLCERSQEHRGHHTFLMEEIAQKYLPVSLGASRLRPALWTAGWLSGAGWAWRGRGEVGVGC